MKLPKDVIDSKADDDHPWLVLVGKCRQTRPRQAQSKWSKGLEENTDTCNNLWMIS